MLRLDSRHLLHVTAAAILLLLLPAASPDISSDREALLALRSSVRGRPLLWNVASATPCSWAGVTCSSGNTTVVGLRLPGMGLSGRIPPKTISNLTNLMTLSLRYNALSGPLPEDLFASLTSLRNIYLQHNFFDGQIPDSLFSLTSLVRVNLGYNDFSGSISPSFSNLTRLATLYLENNHFSGQIPDLNLPLVQFNVSNNNLTGQIPRGLSKNPRSSFVGTSLCGDPLDSCSSENPPKKLPGAFGIIIICVVGFCLILILINCLCKFLGEKRNASGANKKKFEIAEEESSGGGQYDIDCFPAAKERGKRRSNAIRGGKNDFVFLGNTDLNFDLEDLLRASAMVLGKGAFGTVYKAVLDTGLAVAVKRLRDVSTPEKEFREKMDEIGRLNHENLVPLRAYHFNKDEKLLVYDYLPLGSLSALLHGNKEAGRTPLNWETRASIALGAARGISYIHSQSSSVSHGNIKSSNILLTRSYEARVSDTGIAQLYGPSVASNRIAGYMAPEVTDPGKVSQKADVYSFGVLLMELLTGKSPARTLMYEEGVHLPGWVQSVVREEGTVEVFDLELVRCGDLDGDMVRMLKLAVDCTLHDPDKRPSMAEVGGEMEEVCGLSLVDGSSDFVGSDGDHLGLSPI